MYWVYILLCFDGTFYVGHTRDLQDRLARHNAGTAALYTRIRRPVTLVYSEAHTEESNAVAREMQLKKWSRAKKKALIDGDMSRLRKLSH